MFTRIYEQITGDYVNLTATIIGLVVAIPAMFAYNFQVTNIRGMTSELDNLVGELATALDHKYVDNRALADEIRDALQGEKHVA